MPASVVAGKRELLSQVMTATAQFNAPGKPVVFWVPGRIEVLGKHTDYAGGRSLLAATSRGFFFAAHPRSDDRVQVVDVLGQRRLDSRLHPDVTPRLGLWSNYVETVLRRVARNFPGSLKGADIAFVSDLPQAAGMSSSSAMIVGMFLVLSRLNRLDQTAAYRENIRGPEELGGYLGTIENGQTFGRLEGDKGVGTFGGSEDHTAILCCRAGKLSRYAYCPVQFEQIVDMPRGFVFAIGVSGVVAEKTGAAMAQYNRASRLASEALRVWREGAKRDDPHLAGAIARAGKETVRNLLQNSAHPEFSAAELTARFDHFFAENEEILPDAVNALAQGDCDAFGKLVARSQHLGATLLRNQIPETEILAEAACKAGAVAASAFGAGFGGSVWAMVREDDAERFLADWRAAYHRAFPLAAKRSQFFATPAGPAAFEWTAV